MEGIKLSVSTLWTYTYLMQLSLTIYRLLNLQLWAPAIWHPCPNLLPECIQIYCIYTLVMCQHDELLSQTSLMIHTAPIRLTNCCIRQCKNISWPCPNKWQWHTPISPSHFYKVKCIWQSIYVLWLFSIFKENSNKEAAQCIWSVSFSGMRI
jgi:hypothetical protein